MVEFQNASQFNFASRIKAQAGILSPVRKELSSPRILYRFSEREEEALRGHWWLEEGEFAKIRFWAAEHRLAVPHAARVLTAVAHQWSGMRVLVRALVRSPLLAYQGLGADQRVSNKELLAPSGSRTAPRIAQLYIPGLSDPEINRASLLRISTQYFREGDSHIGNTPLFPNGARIQ